MRGDVVVFDGVVFMVVMVVICVCCDSYDHGELLWSLVTWAGCTCVVVALDVVV